MESNKIIETLRDQSAILEQAVREAEAVLEEKKRILQEFRNAILETVLGAVPPDTGPARYAVVAARQARVKKLAAEGKSPAEIARLTDLPLHLINYDLSRLRRQKQISSEEESEVEEQETEQEQPAPEQQKPEQEEEDDRDDRDDQEQEQEQEAPAPEEPEQEADDDQDDQEPETTQEAAQIPGPTSGTPLPPSRIDALKEEIKRQTRGKKAGYAYLLTTTARRHEHRAILDFFGDGRTQTDDSGHVHRIEKFEIHTQANHCHALVIP